TVNLLILLVVIVSFLFYVFFGWLSDQIGRKWVMWVGMTLGLVSLFPGFMLMSDAANQALVAASRATPVVVAADPHDCTAQFNPTGKAATLTSCDIAKAALANAGVGYHNETAPAGAVTTVKVGGAVVPAVDARGLKG